MSESEQYQALYCRAVDQGNIAEIEKYAALGANAHTPCSGFTGIYIAAQRGRLDIINKLKDMGAPFDSFVSSRNETPIFVAAQFNNVEAIALLAEFGCDPNAPAKSGFTPMRMAAENGNNESVKALVKAGASVNAVSDTGSPLMSAALDGRAACIKLLASLGAELNWQNKDGATALFIATCEQQVDAVKALLELGADPNISGDGLTALHAAAERDYADIIDALLDAGANVNAQDKMGVTSAYMAVHFNKLGALKQLLKRGADVNMRQNDSMTPLMLAAQEGFGAIVTVLVKAGADLNAVLTKDVGTIKPGRSVLLFAITFQHIDTVRLLLALGADISGPEDGHCMFPLLQAVACGGVPITQLLLDSGAVLNQQNSRGETAVYTAAANYRHAELKILIAAGADVNLTNNGGTSPIHIATQVSSFDSVKTLVKAGALVGSTDCSCATPLLCAAEKELSPMVKLLYMLGADLATIIAANAANSDSDSTAATANTEIDKRMRNPVVIACINKVKSQMAKECETCGCSTKKLYVCGGCQKVKYCSKECQTRDRKLHRTVCTPSAKA